MIDQKNNILFIVLISISILLLILSATVKYTGYSLGTGYYYYSLMQILFLFGLLTSIPVILFRFLTLFINSVVSLIVSTLAFFVILIAVPVLFELH